MLTGKRLRLVWWVALLPVLCAAPLPGQDQASEKGDAQKLHHEQEALRMRYLRFEETLAKMARYLQETEPAKAEMIYRALARAKAERLGERMSRTTRLLRAEEGGDPQFADAIAAQEAIVAELKKILTILRSEDILDANRNKQERLEKLAAKINVLIDEEKIHRAQTDRGAPTDGIAQKQGQTAKKTGRLISQIKAHDAKTAGAKEAESEQSDAKSADARKGKNSKDPGSQSTDEKRKGGKNRKGEKSEKASEDSKSNGAESLKGSQNSKSKGSESKNGEQKSKSKSSESRNGEENAKSKNSEPRNGKENAKSKSSQAQNGSQNDQKSNKSSQRQGNPSSSKSSHRRQSRSGQSGQKSSQATPGRKQLQQARQRMQRAIQRLQEKQRKQASQQQAEAIRKLIEAKERIEKKLRQLREEERKLLLRSLEARLQKMHQLQQIVLEATCALHETGKKQWKDRDYARCRDAAATEREIQFEAEKALKILRADGTSVAFPLAVRQIRADIAEVARRLGQENTDELTILIEEDILAALEEMIVSLQKEMKEMREQKSQKGGQKAGRSGKRSLVDKIAELKLLKTLQTRINRRTQAIGDLFEGNQASRPDVVSQLRDLSRRQEQLHEATYDLAIGKTTR